MGIEIELRAEIEKNWEKLEREIKNVKPGDKREREFLNNIKAYISDSRYFLNENKLVKSFEAIIFSWGLYEAGLELGMFKCP